MKGKLKSNLKLLVFTTIVVILGFIYIPVNMFTFTWENAILYWGVAISGTIMVYLSSYYIQQSQMLKKLLLYAGNNTLTVLTWHFLCFKLVQFCIICYYNYPVKMLACFPTLYNYGGQEKDGSFVEWLAYSFAGVFIPLIVAYYSNPIRVICVKYINKVKEKR